jgi:hypothetical protein
VKHDNLGHLVSCFKFFRVMHKVFICLHFCIFCVLVHVFKILCNNNYIEYNLLWFVITLVFIRNFGS